MTLSRRVAMISVGVAGLATAGCTGGECGPGDAVDDVPLVIESRTLTFGGFSSSPNNDCPPGDAVATPLTIEALQVGTTDARLILCLPRPDQADGATFELTADPLDFDRIQVVDLFGEDDGCDVRLDRARPLAGTIGVTGMCADGTDPAGYALELDAQVPLVRDCGGVESEVSGEMVGLVAVVAD